MTTKLPYMKWFPADHALDTQHLTLEEDCVYRRLLDAMWMHGGKLAGNDIRLALVARVSDAWWAEHSDIIRAFFISVKGGYISHKRMRSDIAKAARVSANNRRSIGPLFRGVSQEDPKNNDLGSANAPHISDSQIDHRLEPSLTASSDIQKEAPKHANIVDLDAARASRAISPAPTPPTAEDFA